MHAKKALVPFGSTYRCECALSILLTTMKNKARISLDVLHELRCAIRDTESRFNRLVLSILRALAFSKKIALPVCSASAYMHDRTVALLIITKSLQFRFLYVYCYLGNQAVVICSEG